MSKARPTPVTSRRTTSTRASSGDPAAKVSTSTNRRRRDRPRAGEGFCLRNVRTPRLGKRRRRSCRLSHTLGATSLDAIVRAGATSRAGDVARARAGDGGNRRDHAHGDLSKPAVAEGPARHVANLILAGELLPNRVVDTGQIISGDRKEAAAAGVGG